MAALAEGNESPEPPSTFLAMYFHEMAALDVLRPEEEFELARRLEALEIDLWRHILGNPQTIERVLVLVERTIDNSLAEFRPLRRALGEHRQASSKVNALKIDRVAHRVSARLRALDIDRRIVDIVLRTIAAEPARGTGALSRWRLDVVRAAARMQRAKNEFVKANLRLVVSIARRFNHGRMPLADLIQEGNIGLIKAVERFDHRRGYRFSTYASWWIRHAISRALADKGRAVRLPVHMIDTCHRVAKARRDLLGKLGRQATDEEVATATGISMPKIEKMRTFLIDQPFSLDRQVSDEDGRSFIDFLTDPEAEAASPLATLGDLAMTAELRELLADLKPIEASILRQRFGLDDDRELTLKEIGEKYNLSRERIRQLQEQALEKMRRAMEKRELL